MGDAYGSCRLSFTVASTGWRAKRLLRLQVRMLEDSEPLYCSKHPRALPRHAPEDLDAEN
jgi:hypothetical protein